MNRTLLAAVLMAAAAFASGQAGTGAGSGTGTAAPGGLSVSGTVSGTLPQKARVGGFLLAEGGVPVAEVVSVPVNAGRFALELPAGTPGLRPLAALRPDTVFWPGVLEPVSVRGQVSTADLRFYVYADNNGNGRRDDTETIQEAVPFVGRSVLVVSYATGAAQVNASRGFQANLRAGWNGLLIEIGQAVRVTSSSAVSGVTLSVQR